MSDKVVRLKDVTVDLCKKVDVLGADNKVNWLLGHKAKVCRGTNVVFSPYVKNKTNRVRCAFLGQFCDGQDQNSFKRSQCQAMTRYEFDSQSTKDLSLLKGRFYTGQFSKDGTDANRQYVDERIAGLEE